jgi:beta-lactam-binding protein with PASTA domain
MAYPIVDSGNARLKISMTLAALIFLVGCTKKTQVPDVKGMPLAIAQQTLATAQLAPGKVSCSQGDVFPDAKILDQSVKAGEKVPLNTAVDLVVEAPVQLPDLTNKDAAEAIVNLQTLGLRVSMIKQPTLKFLKHGKVLQQAPVPGWVSKDSMVTLTIASGPDFGSLASLVTTQPAYQKLNPEQKNLLDQFLK